MDNSPRRVLVCQHRTCTKDGAAGVLAALQASLKVLNNQEPIGVTVEACGCLGLCGSGPMVLVLPDNVYYWQVTPKKIQVIVEMHLLGNVAVSAMMHPRLHLSDKS